MPVKRYFELDSTVPGLKLSASILARPGFDTSKCDGRRRPVLVYAYSGPGSQTVTTSYGLGYASQNAFHAALVSSHDYVVLTVDAVGTRGKGEHYRKGYTYQQLGLQEREDLIAAAKWASDQCWSDSDKISHWGWSYGGFMSSFIAAKGTGLYHRLISVAPVTSWALYDSVYTERSVSWRRKQDTHNQRWLTIGGIC
jgi:dipeptidyl-peptidase-4